MTVSNSVDITRRRVDYLDFVFAVQLVVVQRILRHSGAPFVHVLHERNVLLCRNETDFVKVGISAPAPRQQCATSNLMKKNTD